MVTQEIKELESGVLCTSSTALVIVSWNEVRGINVREILLLVWIRKWMWAEVWRTLNEGAVYRQAVLGTFLPLAPIAGDSPEQR